MDSALNSSLAMLDLIAWRARESPEKPALFYDGRWYDYRELQLRAQRLASRLHGLGVRRGDRVAILAQNHLAHFDLLFAAPKLGFIFTPFNYRLSGSELGTLARQVQPVLTFAGAPYLEQAESLNLPCMGLADYEAWLLAGGPEQAPKPSPELGWDDAFMLLFTGGTTGVPKAAIIPYRQVLLNARATAEAWALSDADSTIQCTPCFHAALNVLALPLFYRGGRVVLMNQFDPGEYLDLVARHRVTQLFMVPAMYQALALHAGFEDADFRSVRAALTGGAPCSESLQRTYARRGLRLVLGYGLTEAGVNCFGSSMANPDLPFGSLGRPMPGMEARIVAADGSLCGAGIAGELQLKGPMVFAGYWRHEQETAQVLRAGWLRTGDLASADELGNVRVLGRKKELYISGGEKVFPQEVEAAIACLPQVAECAVLGVPDARWGEQGLAAIVTHHGQPITEEQMRDLLRLSLAAYKLPRHYYFLPSLPRNAAGKVMKQEIRKLFEGATRLAPSSLTPSQNP